MAACRSSSTSSPVALRARRSAQEPAPEPFSAARSPQPAPRRRAAAGPAADTHRDQNTLPNRTLSTTRRHRETIASGPISASEAKELSSHTRESLDDFSHGESCHFQTTEGDANKAKHACDRVKLIARPLRAGNHPDEQQYKR